MVIPLTTFMDKRLTRLARVALTCAAMACATPAGAADENATLLRVFLRDGTALVSYGEPARVGDRVIFSMPTGPLPNPPLHLINLPAEKVDWDQTDRYATAARADQYIKGQADIDYAALSGQLVQTLNDVASTTDAAQRLVIVERARQALAEWPSTHYNYKAQDVKQMVGMLDEAIADLRAATGNSRFTLTLEAHTEPTSSPVELLLPPPTLQESIEQVLAASRLVDNAVERTSLLATALGRIDSDKDALPADWVAKTRPAVEERLALEARVDHSYRVMSTGILALADQRARHADVRGVMRLMGRVQERDRELGGARPETVNSLLAAVEEKLDAARRLRLARDQFELRLPVLSQYGLAIKLPMNLFSQIRPSLEDIKALSRSSPATLESLQQSTARMLQLMTGIEPPAELSAAHALMVSAAQMAANAASTRREAVLGNNIDLAWNASSAAAGALMLGARARSDILTLLKPPQLR